METFFINSGKNVLPAAPSPGPRVILSPDVRQGAGPEGEAEDVEDVADELDEEAAEELVAAELLDPPPAVESVSFPQPPSSRSAAASRTTVSEGFVTPASIEQNHRNTCVRRPVLGR